MRIGGIPSTDPASAVGPRVSVIIPVLNEEARIARQLQDLSSVPGLYEVIVVDGGSSDRTLELVRAHPGAHAVCAR